MRAYLIELIDFSVKLGSRSEYVIVIVVLNDFVFIDLIDENNSEIPLEMSTSELIQLKCDIEEKPKDPSIENLRVCFSLLLFLSCFCFQMFCELLKLLTSDLLVKLSFSFCQSRRDTFHLCMFIICMYLLVVCVKR